MEAEVKVSASTAAVAALQERLLAPSEAGGEAVGAARVEAASAVVATVVAAMVAGPSVVAAATRDSRRAPSGAQTGVAAMAEEVMAQATLGAVAGLQVSRQA